MANSQQCREFLFAAPGFAKLARGPKSQMDRSRIYPAAPAQLPKEIAAVARLPKA